MERDSKGPGKGGKGKSDGDGAIKCATGCGKPGTKRCNGCKAVFYCGVECQRIHWKKNGHKAACKKTQARVAAAMASAAGGAPTHTGGTAAEGASVCTICLDVGDPPPIQSGCACRGDAGLAHVGCRIEAVLKRHSGNASGWRVCVTCDQMFSGQMGMGLAEAWWGTLQVFDEEDGERQFAGMSLAISLSELGRYAESETMCRELRAVQQRMSAPHPATTMRTAATLGHALHSQKKNTEADVVLREVLSKRREQLGAEHPDTLSSLMSIGNVLMAQGKLDDAFATYQDVRTIQQRLLGANDPATMTTVMNIASLLVLQCKFQESEVLSRELLGVQQRVLGAEHPTTLATRYTLCLVLYEQEKFVEAEAGCREVLAAYQRVFGAEHPNTQAASTLLVRVATSKHT